MHTYISFSVRISVQSLWKDVDHLVEAVDGGGDEAVGKWVAVVGAENALLLSRIVAEAPEEEMMKGFELVNLLNLLALGRAHQLKWRQRVIAITCISDNAKSTEHVTGLFINSSKSVKKTKLCSCNEARQFCIQDWNIEPALESQAPSVVSAQNLAFRKLFVGKPDFNEYLIFSEKTMSNQESTYTAISFPPCSSTLSSLKNIV